MRRSRSWSGSSFARMALASPMIFWAEAVSSQKPVAARRTSYSASRFFSSGRSKKPPELREAQFELGDVGEGIRGHG